MILSMPEIMVYCHSSETPNKPLLRFHQFFLIRILNVVEWAGSVVIVQYAVCHFFVKAVKTNHSLLYGLGVLESATKRVPLPLHWGRQIREAPTFPGRESGSFPFPGTRPEVFR
jgi:hypothetical protein